MARVIFDDVDQLILEKWIEVSELVTAYETVRDKVRSQIEFVGESLQTWAREQDLEVLTRPKDGEFWVYQRDWLQPSNDIPWASLVVGGFLIDSALGADADRVYAAIYCTSGKRRQLSKDVFGEALRAAVGEKQTVAWSVDTSRSCPMNRYANGVSARSAFIDSERFSKLVLEQFNQLVEFVEPVATSIRKALSDRPLTSQRS